MTYVVRVAGASDPGKPAMVKDTVCATKRDALDMISKLPVQNINKLPNEGKGRIYSITLKSR